MVKGRHGALRGRSGPGRRRGARPPRVRAAARRRGAAVRRRRAARRQRRRPIAIATAASRIAATGTSQAVRSKPDFGGSASTSVPYWATSASLISSLVFPAAIWRRMKARSRSACGAPERLSAVPQIGHITSSSTSGSVVLGSGGAAPSRARPPQPAGPCESRASLLRLAGQVGGDVRVQVVAGHRAEAMEHQPAVRRRPGTTRERPSSPARPGRSRRFRREAADR